MPMRLLRWPLGHFLAIGAVLFALDRWLVVPSPVEKSEVVREVIVITASQVEQLRADYARQMGSLPTAADEAVLIDGAIDEELLYREALARRMDWGDKSIRWRLIQKMRFLTDDPTQDDADLHREALALGLDRDDVVIRRLLIQKMRLLVSLPAAGDVPDEAQLRDYFERNRNRYLQPASVSLEHVFLSAQQRGDSVKRDAERILTALRGQPRSPGDVEKHGDNFALGHRFTSSSERHLRKMFGPDFAEKVMRLESGSWGGPVRSAYGLHLVWIEAKEPPMVPRFESVQGQVAQGLRAERREERLVEAIRRLRDRYVVRVEANRTSTDDT